jgi:hypothetical protein
VPPRRRARRRHEAQAGAPGGAGAGARSPTVTPALVAAGSRRGKLPRAYARSNGRRRWNSPALTLAPTRGGGGGGRGASNTETVLAAAVAEASSTKPVAAATAEGRTPSCGRLASLSGGGGGGARRRRGLATIRCNVAKEELRVTSPHY